MDLTSNFAVLSVRKGRKQLAKHFEPRPILGPCPENLRVPVTITGYIDGIFGKDDGVDQEFTVQVTKLEVGDKANG